MWWEMDSDWRVKRGFVFRWTKWSCVYLARSEGDLENRYETQKKDRTVRVRFWTKEVCISTRCPNLRNDKVRNEWYTREDQRIRRDVESKRKTFYRDFTNRFLETHKKIRNIHFVNHVPGFVHDLQVRGEGPGEGGYINYEKWRVN